MIPVAVHGPVVLFLAGAIHMKSDALLILPGITASLPKREAVLSFMKDHAGCDVYLPPLWQPLGINAAAWQLQRYLRRLHHQKKYERIHFLCYISGGFILRKALAGQPEEHTGRIVHVRGPLQEQVPARVIQRRGRLAAFLAKGRMLFDLASGDKDLLPFVPTAHEQGLVIEHGLSALARDLGIKPEDFTALRMAPGFRLPVADAILETEESHDDVYTSELLLGTIAAFFRTGCF